MEPATVTEALADGERGAGRERKEERKRAVHPSTSFPAHLHQILNSSSISFGVGTRGGGE